MQADKDTAKLGAWTTSRNLPKPMRVALMLAGLAILCVLSCSVWFMSVRDLPGFAALVGLLGMFGLRPRVIREQFARLGLVIWAIALNVFYLGACTVLSIEARAYNLGWLAPSVAIAGLLSTTYFVVSSWRAKALSG